jgi:hypothetical protein
MTDEARCDTPLSMAVVQWDSTARSLSWVGSEGDELPAPDPQVCASMCTLCLDPLCLSTINQVPCQVVL